MSRYGGCDNPDEHEREGRDAGRWGEGHGWEHREKMDNARWGSSDSCDAAYAEGYEKERRYQDGQAELRREEEEAEMRHQQRLAEERAWENNFHE